ncbi:hypothetical protein IZ6_04090 [Terrihabitans soli]|uniref:Ketopantoate reductase N-terminal domain-containing protein n=1 Tax=Terrihabitans soli TaxID=708113 RepID=A0A6S6QHN8_9HYPH|nr:hypothetical protein [Terrihabitans soli]BCJ89674.1 hypothetical protein IZ6_04090 [Terrihabitans soli]
MTAYNVMIFGASYGSLLGTKLAMAGHNVTLVCLKSEADLINTEGTRVRMPVKGPRGPMEIEVHSRNLPGRIRATTTAEADVNAHDLVGLAMQEPQYGSPGVRELLEAVADSKKPCMSIMNMPPLAYLKRIPKLGADKLRYCFTDPSVWDRFDPELVTLCSPDPQAFRPPEEKSNLLQVTLPTNFKAARFTSQKHTDLLKVLQKDIEAVRFDSGEGPVEVPIKLKVHESIFVPLAKWAMLLTGNYRCVELESVRSIRDAVHSNLAESRDVYEWVQKVCIGLGASPDDMVPFEKYANAATGLVKPSSAARALAAGAPNIERVDLLVQSSAAALGLSHPVVDRTVAYVDAKLASNRRRAA